MPREPGLMRFLADLYREIDDDNVFYGAAALAFFLLLSVFPGMIALLSVLPHLPVPDLERAIMDFVGQALPENAAGVFRETLRSSQAEGAGGLFSLGIAFAIWTASSGMYAIMRQLNVTFDVAEGRSFVKGRAIAIALTLFFGVLVLGSFALIVFGGVVEDWLTSALGWDRVFLYVFAAFRWAVILALLLLGFAVIFYFGPNADRPFRLVSPGGAVGVALLVLGSVGFRIYVENFGAYDATYGSIGAVIVLLLWLYLAGFVILLGSEIDALVDRYAHKPRPREREPAGG